MSISWCPPPSGAGSIEAMRLPSMVMTTVWPLPTIRPPAKVVFIRPRSMVFRSRLAGQAVADRVQAGDRDGQATADRGPAEEGVRQGSHGRMVDPVTRQVG